MKKYNTIELIDHWIYETMENWTNKCIIRKTIDNNLRGAPMQMIRRQWR